MTFINTIVVFVLLLGTWLILSGFFDPFFISLGVISCGLSVYWVHRFYPGKLEHISIAPVLARFVVYLGWLEVEIIKSSLKVLLKIWQVNLSINPSFQWISCKQKHDLGTTILGNSITLTPGTVTVLARDGMLRVHALDANDLDDLRDGHMDAKVLNVVAPLDVSKGEGA